jgi:hypothetical protein
MSFAEYLHSFLNKKIFEKKESFETSDILNQLETKVGGKLGDEASEKTSFEALQQVIDQIPLEEIESSPENLSNLVKVLISPERIDFLEKFTEYETNINKNILKSIKNLDREKEETKFINYLATYNRVSERLLKIYNILSSQEIVSVDEALQVDLTIKNKVAKIIQLSRTGIEDSVNGLITQEKKVIESFPEDESTQDKLKRYNDLMQMMGWISLLRNDIDSRLKKIEAESKPKKQEKLESGESDDTASEKISQRTKYKVRIAKRIIRAIGDSQLPPIENSKIISPGGYFTLFRSLDDMNKAWMDWSLSNYIFKGELELLSKFNSGARFTESPLEEDQILYLNAARSWVLSYIKSDSSYDLDSSPENKTPLAAKSEDSLATSLENTATAKEKEIANYYLSKDFNLGNFGGFQIKPEIRIQLYQKVKLAVTDEDRKKESPLRNMIKGLGQIIGGLFSQIPDRGNFANARAAKERNMAIVKGLNLIVKAGVTVVGGKQAGRDYAEKTEKFISPDKKGQVKEDMLSLADSSGGVVVNPEAPGQIHQTPDAMLSPNMDKFSLVGPGKKKKKKGEKPALISNQVISSFDEFMQTTSSDE